MKKEVFSPITGMYSEKFRLNSMNTQFGVSNISDEEMERKIIEESKAALIHHHSKYLGKIYPGRQSLTKPSAPACRTSTQSTPGAPVLKWSPSMPTTSTRKCSSTSACSGATAAENAVCTGFSA